MNPKNQYIEKRMARLRVLLHEAQADAILINRNVNLHYFSGFRGDDTLLLISETDAILITDSRYTEQAVTEAPLYTLVENTAGLWQHAADVIAAHGWKEIAFEDNGLLYADYAKLSKHLTAAGQGATLEKPMNLSELRIVKDAEEIACIRKAAEIADKAFDDICAVLRPGIPELAVAARLESTMRALGSERPAFPTIVASGVRGSLPHGVATEKLIVAGEFVTMDYGAVYHGYHSDMTRTVCVGKADAKQRGIYDLVLRAQKLGVSRVQPQASGKEIDAAVRALLTDAGYGKAFGHGLGHSLGLEIHEEPRLSPKSTCKHLLPGTLITVEPGIYLPGWGGLRIEDTVLVTEDGAEILTRSRKELIEIL